MDHQNLLDLMASLSREQQAAVEEFARFLKEHSAGNKRHITFRKALDAFTREHEDLLRRLALT